MTDMQAVNKQPQALDTKSDTSADMSTGSELNATESSFTQLFSLFNNENKAEGKSESKNMPEVSDSKGGTEDSEPLMNAVDEKIITTELDNVIADESQQQAEPEAESNDDFLARLGQSSMLLQETAVADPVTPMPNDANGNKLPPKVNETAPNTISASTLLDDMQETPSVDMTAQRTSNPNVNSDTHIALNGDVTVNDTVKAKSLDRESVKRNQVDNGLVTFDPANRELVDGEIVSAVETSEAMQPNAQVMGLNMPTLPTTVSTISAMTGMTDMTESDASLSKDEGLNTKGLTTKNGLLDRDQLAFANNSNFSAALAEVTGGKNIPFGQANGVAANMGATASAMVETGSASELLPTTPAEPIEQLDFAQIMESARKPEPLEQATRTMAKAAGLTDVEQQVLEKRVNLNNNLASSELNEKIAIMAGKELQTATIRLDPAELGSMNIKLVMQNDQLNVTIQAQNPQSRDLLEQQMPRLREMLQQQGMTLGDTQVQADSGQQQQSGFQQSGQENGQKNSNNETNYAIDSQSEVPVAPQYWQDSAKGVDFYA
ncbi:flagellar hook-length control protein FliK [Moritella sp. 24]|nr:flagellar hook-length control protein FliK [Moritella sp. 24]